MNRIRLTLILCAFLLQAALAQTLKKEDIEQLKFRYIGPIGNRISCAIGIPGNDLVYFAGAASGGLWKTTDGGLSWRPVFDDKNVASVSALAAAASDHQIMFAGTGESFIRSNVTIGNGVYKSTDGGETWQLSGLENTGRISRIVIHPTNPDIIYVCSVGHAYAPQKERGVYKSTDGGKTWRQVLFVDENTGASDLVMDPTNPRILFAGMWQISLKNWNRTSGGPGSGLHMSTDGGETWKKLSGSGLPEGPVGKIALTMTPAAPNRVYALIETGDGLEKLNDKDKAETGELWRSDDKGKSWTLMSSDRNMSGRQAYYTRTAASPDNPNEIYFINAGFFTSIDGGRSLEPITSFLSQPYGDHHDMWIDPTNANRSIVSHDGGISISKDRCKSWSRIALPIAQLYHVTVDNNIPYNVLTNRQDGPSMRGPSRSGIGSFFGMMGIPSIGTGMWHEVGGGESGFATPDPKDPDVIWSTASGTGAVGGVVVRFNEKNRQFRQVEIWPDYVAGTPAADVKYRFQWTFPLLISPHDHNTVYAASQMVHKTTNGGQSWQVISPDLTLNDKKQQQQSGGLTPDNIGVEYANVISAFEESPMKQGLLWTGSSDGQINVTQDGGKTWTNVSKNFTDLPAQGAVRNIEASKYAEGKAFLVVDFHEQGNFQPYAYRTTDYGKTWKKIVKGIEPGISYCRSIKEDPIRKGLLYLGTETALYISFDDGDTWQPFMNNLPHTPFYWLEVQEHFNDLVIGTYGRGVWILDDLTPLQQLPVNAAETKAALFNPKDAYRFQARTSSLQQLPEPSWGFDPPYGASINYWTNSDKDSVKVYITSASGDTIRTFKQKGKAGINRIWWDLQNKPTKDIMMHTKPLGGDWVSWDKDRKRPAHVATFKSYMVPPGKYNVVMTTAGQTFKSSVNLLKDPHSDGSADDIKAQTDMLASMYKDINSIADMVNELEIIRRQVYDMRDVLKPKASNKKLVAAAGKLDSAIIKVESKLIQLKYTGTGQDDVRYPEMLAGRIAYLAGAVGTADFAPADQHKEVYAMLKEKLAQSQNEMDALLKGEVAAFTKQLDDSGIKPIVITWKKP
ncbi:MAG: sialidase [Bacteroidetes bacterium]|nr:sialidase [Bacteroidota bacterium]